MLDRFLTRLDHLRAVSEHITPHLARERKRVVAGIVLSFVAAGAGVLSAMIMASVLDVLRNGPPRAEGRTVDVRQLLDLNTAGSQVSLLLAESLGRAGSTEAAILLLGVLLLLTTAIAVTSNAASRWLWVSVRVRVIAEMQARLFTHLLYLPMAFHVRHRTGTLLSRLYSDVGGAASVLPSSGLSVPLALGGSLFAPSVEVKAGQVATGLAAGAVKGKAEELKKGAEERVRREARRGLGDALKRFGK